MWNAPHALKLRASSTLAWLVFLITSMGNNWACNLLYIPIIISIKNTGYSWLHKKELNELHMQKLLWCSSLQNIMWISFFTDGPTAYWTIPGSRLWQLFGNKTSFLVIAGTHFVLSPTVVGASYSNAFSFSHFSWISSSIFFKKSNFAVPFRSWKTTMHKVEKTVSTVVAAN